MQFFIFNDTYVNIIYYQTIYQDFEINFFTIIRTNWFSLYNIDTLYLQITVDIVYTINKYKIYYYNS